MRRQIDNRDSVTQLGAYLLLISHARVLAWRMRRPIGNRDSVTSLVVDLFAPCARAEINCGRQRAQRRERRLCEKARGAHGSI